MPNLTQSLRGRDLGHLRIVAEHWGIELKAPDARIAQQRLATTLFDPDLLEEVIGALPDEARDALADLLQHDGRLLWVQFTHRHGTIREMGPGRRDRERPDRNPASPAEILWYRALIARAFFDTPDGPQEFAFLPEDLTPLLPLRRVEHHEPLGRPASPNERAHPLPIRDRILDHATTLLAALRAGLPSLYGEEKPEVGVNALHALLLAANILTPDSVPIPAAARAFLEAPRPEALAQLARAWLHSPDFDELRLLPGLQAGGDWKNDPLRARQTVLDFLSSIPADTWWSLNAFVAAIKTRYPDFQRSEYDSWYLRDEATGEYLRGIEHWDDVDGALIRYIVTGPLHWLGVVDLAKTEADSPPTAFRFLGGGLARLTEPTPAGDDDVEKVHIRSDGRITAPRLASRAARYQIARFCVWEDEKPNEYRYRLTPSSLSRAREHGLRVGHLIRLLARHSDGIPPNVTKALKGWEARGASAFIEQLSVLRFSSPNILQALRRSRAARFLGDPIGPAAIVVKPGAEEKVLAALVEMGYLGEVVG
ncbi:MAG: helicase-associated domain-containing protein [Anaerolineales bacterium]